ncbi:Syntaxin-42 [Hibiscus syriacus]|uniref:Syntaxin-42 n=1 Tax=Hibiscus syriacus TaxID=106335 RepID=A0A6A3A3R2_HIBSY|nr:Syntaxin-42 [Hibiscus syriacus]
MSNSIEVFNCGYFVVGICFEQSALVLEMFWYGFNKHQMSKLKQSEFSTEEREREITQVVQSVNELAQMMKDLSALVIDQGTIVDRIDYNIQNVATSVEEGFKQLQKKGGMLKCATVLVILCFIMIVLLILKGVILMIILGYRTDSSLAS